MYSHLKFLLREKPGIELANNEYRKYLEEKIYDICGIDKTKEFRGIPDPWMLDFWAILREFKSLIEDKDNMFSVQEIVSFLMGANFLKPLQECSIITHFGSVPHLITDWFYKFTKVKITKFIDGIVSFPIEHLDAENTLADFFIEKSKTKYFFARNEDEYKGEFSVDKVGADGPLFIGAEKGSVVFPQRINYLHMTFFVNEKTTMFNQRLKFAFFISGTMVFHCQFIQLTNFEAVGFYQIQSLFIISIRFNIQKKNSEFSEKLKKTRLNICVFEVWWEQLPENYLEGLVLNNINRAWADALDYLSLDEKSIPFDMFDLFEIGIENVDPFMYGMTKLDIGVKMRVPTQKDANPYFFEKLYLVKESKRQGLGKDLSSYEKEKLEFREPIDLKNYDKIIRNAWIKSQIIDFIPIGNVKDEIPANRWTKRLCSAYIIRNHFERALFDPMVYLLKKWYSMTEKGIYIKNFNQTLMDFIGKLQLKIIELVKTLKELDTEMPSYASVGQHFSNQEINTINYYSRRAFSFFERHLKKIWYYQIRMLQYECSVKFKEKILKVFLEEPLKWETGHTQAVRECEDLFLESGKDFEIPILKKNTK
mmetsp:Transcript_27484/g.53607  ORF Transcript_27484/g.53607 Transcript_27484/m.53607 type:complete len:593 (-) Transcript_27484:500-2278(-)